MVRQTNQHLWMTQANDSKYWCCPHKIYIFMLSNWYVVGTMLGMVTNTKRKEPYSRGAGGEDGHEAKSFWGTKEDEVFLRASGRFQQGVAAVLSPEGRDRHS